MSFWSNLTSRSGSYKYESLAAEPAQSGRRAGKPWFLRTRSFLLMAVSTALALLVLQWLFAAPLTTAASNSSCDTVKHGFECTPKISHWWGQYSPFFSVPSEISPEIPTGCSVSFVQVLSRHGGRDPTSSKTVAYNKTVNKIQQNVKSYPGVYAFLANFTYTLGADQLSTLGRQEMVNSGIKFFDRYGQLTKDTTPFVRSSGQQRVVESAEAFLDGFYKTKDGGNSSEYPDTLVTISEDAGFNNTLSHSLCTAFEDGWASSIGDAAQSIWADIFLTPIQARLNSHLVGANLTLTETLYVMDLCPFVTMADANGKLSGFCNLFSEDEWHQYDYYETLGKYYGYGNGNPLGPTQGVGFANELIARLTDSPVVDHTSTNATLDSDNATFPLGRKVYADFSHDNDITPVLAVLGLYNSTKPLSNTTIETTEQTNGYSAAWTVPFASRAYFEKLQCSDSQEEKVRIIVNDRVVPLESCGADARGMCSLGKFIDSLDFVQSGGRWNECFA